MESHKSWNALLAPGQATDFFQIDSFPKITVGPEYDGAAAWLLSEVSRLIYRQEEDEIGQRFSPPTRNELLIRAGLQEICFINHSGTQAAVFRSLASAKEDFALLVFRGTQTLTDWITNLEARPVTNPEGGLIHKGFKAALDSVWQEIEKVLLNIEIPAFFTGHSLGGALAIAAASRSKLRPTAVYTFGSPRVGDREFNTLLDDIPVYRLVNNSDIVPTLPPPGPAYQHAGELRLIDAAGEMIVNPDRRTRIRRRLESLFDFDDLRGQLESLAPHRMLYEHAPVNYSFVLRELIS